MSLLKLVGIENPDLIGTPIRELTGVIIIENRSMATSDNYRNILDIGGEIIGHTINPILGKPIQTNVLSVSPG